MATFAGEVFWRGDDGSECRLRSTELGWEVELLDRGQATVQRERVRSALKARQLAKTWKRHGERGGVHQEQRA
jgi:hypothetical protein